MHLRDATGKAAVELFLRTLAFPFPARDILGIPGGLVGLDQPRDEQDLVLLIHELEHLNALTYPIGIFLTALGVRVHDLRNSMNAQANKVRILRDPDGHSAKVGQLTLTCARMAEFTRLLLTTIELFTPLLEGLSMLSEMELDYSDRQDLSIGWKVALGLEATYHVHGAMIANADLVPALASKKFVTELMQALERQVQYSRQLRRMGDLVDLVFWHLDSDRPGRAMPYFQGYLYLKRLFQAWRNGNNKLKMEDFYPLATRLICSVLPLSILTVYSFKDHPGTATTPTLRAMFGEFLEKALSLSKLDLELLRTSKQLLDWNWKDGKLRTIPQQTKAMGQKASVHHDVGVIGELIWHVFDCRSPEDPKIAEHSDLLSSLEASKFVFPAGAHVAIAAAVDEDAQAVLLLDKSRMSEPGARVDATWHQEVTYVLLRKEEFKEFLAIMESAASPLPRVRLGSPPYKIEGLSSDRQVLLSTIWHFWPEGVGVEVDGELEYLTGNPVTFVRRLVCKNRRVFVERTESKDVGTALAVRAVAQRLVEGLRKTLYSGYEEPRNVLSLLSALVKNSLVQVMIDENLARYPVDDLPAIQALCRSVYNRLLFPALEESTDCVLEERKLGILSERLEPSSTQVLRRWLHGGLVLADSGSYGVLPDDQPEAVVAAVSAAAQSCLGIPLVALKEGRVVLDLIPPKASAMG